MSAQPPTDRPVSTDSEERRFSIPPGAIVIVLGVVLLGIIIAGVALNARGEPGVSAVTIADLRADPDRWDNRSVVIEGHAEEIRQLPYLDQYAVYTFRDETGSILALTRKGSPPHDAGEIVRLQAIYHSKVTLDDELKEIVDDTLGPLAGAVVGALVPGVPLNVVFLEHERYEVCSAPDVRCSESESPTAGE